MEQLIERARDNRADRIHLSHAVADGNAGGFYAKLGFVPTGEIEDGEVLMVLELEPRGTG